MSGDQTIVEVIYNALGKPSLISASATILSGFALALIRKNKSRNEFIDELMKMSPLDKDEFVKTIASIKELFDAKFDGLDKRFDDLIQMLDALKNK